MYMFIVFGGILTILTLFFRYLFQNDMYSRM